MAAARPPQLSDARVPCPLCGGLIHPVAGRCKHCKQDLTAFRSNRPQAAVQLPALNGVTGNGHAAAAVSAPIPAPMAREESQPVLPPRPTDRPMPAAAAEGSAWRHWPIVVMSLAVLAILVAVVVLLWPPSATSHAGKLAPSPSPAPERMETNPLAPQVQPPPPAQPADPWGAPNPPSAPHAQITPRQTPDPLPQDPADDTDSLDQMLGQGGVGSMGSSMGSMNGASATVMMMMQHLCDRVTQCGTANRAIQLYCTSVASVQHGPPQTAPCDARARCLEHIDELSCSTKLADQAALLSLMSQFQDCIDAMTRC